MGGVERTGAASIRRRARRSRIWSVVRWSVTAAALGVAAIVVVGKRAEFAGATTYLEHVQDGWIAVGLGCEVLAIVAFALMQQRLLAIGSVDAGLGVLSE